MSQAETFYEGHSLYGGLTWSSVSELIGQGLRERYQVPKELSPKLLALVRKLDTVESIPSRAPIHRNTGRSRRLLFEALCATG